jgi:hypothetical protein
LSSQTILLAVLALASLAIATVLQGLVLKGAFLLLTILSFALYAWFLVLSPEERSLALGFL